MAAYLNSDPEPEADITTAAFDTHVGVGNIKPLMLAYFILCSLILCLLVYYACRKFGYNLCWDYMLEPKKRGYRNRPQHHVTFDDKSHLGIKMPVPMVIQSMLDFKYAKNCQPNCVETGLGPPSRINTMMTSSMSREPRMIVTVVKTSDMKPGDIKRVVIAEQEDDDDPNRYTTNRIKLR